MRINNKISIEDRKVFFFYKNYKEMFAMKKIWQGIGSVLFYVVLISLILVILTVINAKKNGEVPNIFGYKLLEILSGSMEPTIEEGSLILIKETPKDKIENSDIITFRYEGTNNIVTHRIVKVIKDGEEFITRGDANNADDPRIIKYSEVEGVVKSSIPSIGKIISSISENIVIIIGAIIVLIIGSTIFSRYRKKQGKI